MISLGDILVTGGSGRLGAALGALGCNALPRQQLDITSTDSLHTALSKHKPKLIINAAAYTAVDKAESHPAAAFAVNRDGAANLADMCAPSRIPIIHISTDCVFGDGALARPVTENDKPMPLSIYGQSKLAGEQAIRAAGRQRVCIARVSWLFDRSAESFIGKILTAAKTRDTLKIVDDAYGRPTFVHDLAVQLLALAERILDGMPLPEILHLGPQNPVNRYQWAKIIFTQSAALGGPDPALTPCSSEAFEEAARRPRGLILDVATANALLGQMPDWRKANANAVASLLTHAHAESSS